MNNLILSLVLTEEMPHGDGDNQDENSLLPGENDEETSDEETSDEETSDEETGDEETGDEETGDEDLPEKYEVPEEFKNHAEAIEAYAKEHKMSQQALDAGLKLVQDMSAQAVENRKAELAASEKALKEEWGKDFKAHFAIAKKAAKVIDKEAGGQFVKYLTETGAHQDPNLIRILFAAGRAMKVEGKGRKVIETKTKGSKKTGWDVPVEQALADSYKEPSKK